VIILLGVFVYEPNVASLINQVKRIVINKKTFVYQCYKRQIVFLIFWFKLLETITAIEFEDGS